MTYDEVQIGMLVAVQEFTEFWYPSEEDYFMVPCGLVTECSWNNSREQIPWDSQDQWCVSEEAIYEELI